jgi:Tol biopolymer transport system component
MSPPAIVFSSARALNGSDAANTNGARNIWVVSADGTVATPLTGDTAAGVRNGDAVWSPDTTTIVFDSNRPSVGPNINSGNDIWIMKADGTGLSGLTEIGTVPIGSARNPDWSPDSRKLAFTDTCCGLSSESDVAVMNADGSGFVLLTSVPVFAAPGVGSFVPHWSPNGSKLIFVSQLAVDNTPALNLNTTANIWVMNADGSGQAALSKVTVKNADCSEPVWSPDGSRLAFVSARALDGSDATDPNNTSNIWLMNADGSGLTPMTRLTAAGAASTAPVWSLDGSKLAFESSGDLDGSDNPNTNMTVNIWIMDADGTGVTPLTKLTAANASSHDPAWSPGGLQIAFDSLRALDGNDSANASSNIWIINADGSGATPLTRNTAVGADSQQPKWRP